MKTIRIACGQGFWGDWLEAPVNLVRQGPIDYLILDYLAEVTMSILARHKQKHPSAGYARDFVDLIDRLVPDLLAKNIRVVANAGGVNALSCGEALRKVAEKHGVSDRLRIAVVTGDDLLTDLSQLEQDGEELRNLDTGASFEEIRGSVRSANAYLGAGPIVEALQSGAQIVVTGRVADPALALAPMIHELGWNADDWDKLASGIVAGHVIECGAQCTGGNCSVDWQSIPDLADIGYPIAEMAEDGTFFITKHPGTGGRVSAATVKEQIVYEIGDPKSYLTPDVIADFTSFTLTDAGPDRVRIEGARGRRRPEKLKVSMSYAHGYSASGTLVYTWPDACAKARAGADIVRKRLDAAGVNLAFRAELVGINSCHGALTDIDLPEIPEVMLRIAVRSAEQAAVERFTREIAPLVLNGPPSATAYFNKPQVQEVIAYWPTLIERSRVQHHVTFV
ncbi:MAG: acyclic terpene utilization AtuA family protein [Bdellovibrionota bacterium]